MIQKKDKTSLEQTLNQTNTKQRLENRTRIFATIRLAIINNQRKYTEKLDDIASGRVDEEIEIDSKVYRLKYHYNGEGSLLIRLHGDQGIIRTVYIEHADGIGISFMGLKYGIPNQSIPGVYEIERTGEKYEEKGDTKLIDGIMKTLQRYLGLEEMGVFRT